MKLKIKVYISNFRYTFDKKNKKELLISISPYNRNIKLWKIKNWECLYNYLDLYKDWYLRTACFLNYNDKIYIVASQAHNSTDDPIIILDLKGNKIKEINDSNANTLLIDSYFDEEKSKMHIISSNRGYSKSYDYNNNKPYYKYNEMIMLVIIIAL